MTRSEPSPPPHETYTAVAALMQAGRLSEAERLCRQGLAKKQPNPERLHYALGHIFVSRREFDKAANALRAAVALAPDFLEALHALSFVLKELGDGDDALAVLMRAAELPGAGVEVHFNLAVMRRERGENRLSIEAFRRVLDLDPRLSNAWQGLGIAYRNLNEIDQAIAALRRAVECDPRNVGAYVALGTLLLDLGRPGSVEPLSQAAALDHRNASIAERHARALAQAGRFAEAYREHERARALAPGSAACVLSHARTLAEEGRTDAADNLCREVIGSAGATPDEKAMAHHELADRHLARGDVAAARSALDTALALSPASSEIRMRRAMLLLSLGEFGTGWKEFEARFEAGIGKGGIARQPFRQPRWQGEDLRDRTILVWGEQGIGDDIVAASMLPDLAARAGRVLIHSDARLKALFERSFPSNVIFFPRVLPVQPELFSGDISFQVPLGGLAEFLRPSWESFGQPRAFLRPAADRVDHFRSRYAGFPGRKIGIAWRSGNLVNGRTKSTSLDAWNAVLSIPGVTFINLQYGDCSGDLAQVEARLGVRVHHDPDVDQFRDMDTFAAQVASLDLVLSVSNAIAHTAGSLGLPTWVLLASEPLWLWFRGRTDSPWYPQVRLFRQSRPGDWSEPMSDAAAALKAWAQAPGRQQR